MCTLSHFASQEPLGKGRGQASPLRLPSHHGSVNSYYQQSAVTPALADLAPLDEIIRAPQSKSLA